MKVVDFNDTTHTISLIPRYDVTTNVDAYIFNETTKVQSTLSTITYAITDGILEIEFDYTFTENGKYQLKLVQNSNGEIVYRGRIIGTDQTPDEYKLTNGLYFYE